MFGWLGVKGRCMVRGVIKRGAARRIADHPTLKRGRIDERKRTSPRASERKAVRGNASSTYLTSPIKQPTAVSLPRFPSLPPLYRLLATPWAKQTAYHPAGFRPREDQY